MSDSLADLEARRTAVQLQIALLGDMRSGSITGTGGRCGNPNCHCHQAGDPGHGPYYRLTRKVNGKYSEGMPGERPFRISALKINLAFMNDLDIVTVRIEDPCRIVAGG